MIKIKGYTNEDIEFVMNNYDKQTYAEIAKAINKKVNSISYVVQKLGLLKQPHKSWSSEEEEYLKENYLYLSSEEMASHLNRTVPSINARCTELNLIKHDLWTDEEINYLNNNYDKYTHQEIGKYLNRSEQAVRVKCFELNLYKKELPWEEWEIDFVKDHYMDLPTSEISQRLNRTVNAVKLKAERMGYKKSPYNCDYHYFDNIDTEEKAYWLGFLSADGWISKNNFSSAVGIELQYGDIGHLKKFNKSIKGNYQITDRWRKCLISNSDKANHTCIIRIFSNYMYDSLEKLGFSDNKSYDVGIPNMRDDLYKHYIRGYFDGDGCFTFTDKSFHVSFITASKNENDDIINVLTNNDINIFEYSYISEYGTVMYRPSIYKLQDKIKFLDWIYKDASIYLDRKYKKYLKAKMNYSFSDGLAV